MKRRPKPKPPTPNGSVEHHLARPRIKNLIKKIRLDRDFRPGDLDDDNLLMAMLRVAEGRRMSSRELSRYEQAMVETTPILAAPQMEAGTDDVRTILSMGEMQEFMKNWTGEKPARGPQPNFAGTKLVMCVSAMAGASANVDDALDDTSKDGELLILGQTLTRVAEDRARPSLPGIGAKPTELKLPSYSRLCDHMPKLAFNGITEALRARVAMFKALRALEGLEGRERICTTLLLDGTDVPAWVQQKGHVGDVNPDRERKLRGRCPEAGFRMYARKNGEPGGKRDVKDTDNPKAVLQAGKKWRGYYLVTLLDQATGLPIVHVLMDAADDEAAALPTLLELLFEVWPDCPVERIVGDSAWDEDWANKLCMVNYGIDPIFRLAENNNEDKTLKKGDSRDGTVKGITADGQLVCSAHNKRLAYKTFERPNRAPKDKTPLSPGEASDAATFRVRADGGCGCGTVGLGARRDWSRLVYYPHHPNGRPDLYAQRVAWIDRLSGIESFHNRLKSRKLAIGGAARTRITDKTTVQCLIELASLSMVASALHDQRDLHGHKLHLAVPESGEIEPGGGIGVDIMGDVAA